MNDRPHLGKGPRRGADNERLGAAMPRNMGFMAHFLNHVDGERPFFTNRSRYGLAQNLTFYGLAAIADNIQKGAEFLLLYGL